MSNIRIEIDGAKIYREKYLPKIKVAQKNLDSEVLKSCEPYVPMETGAMAARARASGNGQVSWNIRYVRYQYYGFKYNHRRDRHPMACAQWFEKAKAQDKSTWVQHAERTIHQ